jgi:hypothetical protein
MEQLLHLEAEVVFQLNVDQNFPFEVPKNCCMKLKETCLKYAMHSVNKNGKIKAYHDIASSNRITNSFLHQYLI